MTIEYWSRLAKSAFLSDLTLRECVKVLHEDIVAVWNFDDPDEARLLCMLSSSPDGADCYYRFCCRIDSLTPYSAWEISINHRQPRRRE